jgi:TctA family transporter
MLIDIIVGVCAGVLFGLIPALHINFVAYLFLYFGLFTIFPDRFYFFLSISISQLITSYLPQTFFSVPNVENIMHLFPLHRLYLKGKAFNALLLTFIGSFFGAIFAILLLPFLYLLFSSLIGFNYFVSFAIIFVFLSFLYFEKTMFDRLIVFFILLSSGALGIFTLKYNFGLKEPLFVCVIGLFSLPLLLKSIFEKPVISKQVINANFNYPLNKSLWWSFIGSISSLFIILVPSFSSSQASTIVSRFKSNLSSNIYLILFSSISISALIYSYFLAIFFNKPRLGYIAVLLTKNQIILKIDLILYVVAIILSVGITIFILSSILENTVYFFSYLNLNLFNIIIFIFCVLLVIFISGLSAIPFLLLSYIIGSIPLQYNKSRVLLMGYIMLPTLLFYL